MDFPASRPLNTPSKLKKWSLAPLVWSVILSSVTPIGATPSTWATTGSMGNGRYSHAASLLVNGKVLVTGGMDGAGTPVAEIYDPAAETWSNTATMSTNRSAHTATLLVNGKASPSSSLYVFEFHQEHLLPQQSKLKSFGAALRASIST